MSTSNTTTTIHVHSVFSRLKVETTSTGTRSSTCLFPDTSSSMAWRAAAKPKAGAAAEPSPEKRQLDAVGSAAVGGSASGATQELRSLQRLVLSLDLQARELAAAAFDVFLNEKPLQIGEAGLAAACAVLRHTCRAHQLQQHSSRPWPQQLFIFQ